MQERIIRAIDRILKLDHVNGAEIDEEKYATIEQAMRSLRTSVIYEERRNYLIVRSLLKLNYYSHKLTDETSQHIFNDLFSALTDTYDIVELVKRCTPLVKKSTSGWFIFKSETQFCTDMLEIFAEFSVADLLTAWERNHTDTERYQREIDRRLVREAELDAEIEDLIRRNEDVCNITMNQSQMGVLNASIFVGLTESKDESQARKRHEYANKLRPLWSRRRLELLKTCFQYLDKIEQSTSSHVDLFEAVQELIFRLLRDPLDQSYDNTQSAFREFFDIVHLDDQPRRHQDVHQAIGAALLQTIKADQVKVIQQVRSKRIETLIKKAELDKRPAIWDRDAKGCMEKMVQLFTPETAKLCYPKNERFLYFVAKFAKLTNQSELVVIKLFSNEGKNESVQDLYEREAAGEVRKRVLEDLSSSRGSDHEQPETEYDAALQAFRAKVLSIANAYRYNESLDPHSREVAIILHATVEPEFSIFRMHIAIERAMGQTHNTLFRNALSDLLSEPAPSDVCRLWQIDCEHYQSAVEQRIKTERAILEKCDEAQRQRDELEDLNQSVIQSFHDMKSEAKDLERFGSGVRDRHSAIRPQDEALLHSVSTPYVHKLILNIREYALQQHAANEPLQEGRAYELIYKLLQLCLEKRILKEDSVEESDVQALLSGYLTKLSGLSECVESTLKLHSQSEDLFHASPSRLAAPKAAFTMMQLYLEGFCELLNPSRKYFISFVEQLAGLINCKTTTAELLEGYLMKSQIDPSQMTFKAPASRDFAVDCLCDLHKGNFSKPEILDRIKPQTTRTMPRPGVSLARASMPSRRGGLGLFNQGRQAPSLRLAAAQLASPGAQKSQTEDNQHTGDGPLNNLG